MRLQFIEAGEIVTTHGVKGEVKVLSWMDSPEVLCEFDRCRIAGTNYTIEIFYNGEWTTVVSNVPASEIKATNNNSTEGYVFFDLGGILNRRL